MVQYRRFQRLGFKEKIMSKTDAIRLSVINCINRISMLDANMFVQEMHMFDVDKLILNEFYKMFKLIDLNDHLLNFNTGKFTSCSSSTSTQKSHPLLLAWCKTKKARGGIYFNQNWINVKRANKLITANIVVLLVWLVGLSGNVHGNNGKQLFWAEDIPVEMVSFGACEADGYLYLHGGHKGKAHTYSKEHH